MWSHITVNKIQIVFFVHSEIQRADNHSSLCQLLGRNLHLVSNKTLLKDFIFSQLCYSILLGFYT